MNALCAVAASLLTLLPSAFAADAGSFLRQGDAAFAAGEYNVAVRHYTSAIDLDPGTALFYTKRAAAHISLRHQSQALRDLDRAVEVDPNFTQGFLHRGKLHRQICSLTAARRDLDAVLQRRPGQKAATAELAALSELQQRLEQLEAAAGGAGAAADAPVADQAAARQLLQGVYESAPDCVPAQLVEARLELAAGNLEQAVAVTGKLLRSQPGSLAGLLVRGRAYMLLGDHDLAKRHYGEALKYDPDFAPAKLAFNRIKDLDRKRSSAQRALEENAFQEAAQLFEAALLLEPRHLQVNTKLLRGLCDARGGLGQVAEALEACEQALAADGGDEGTLVATVRLMMKAEKWDAAVARVRDALARNQRSGTLHQLLQEAERGRKLASRKDYYKVLGVAKDASQQDIKRAYKRLAMQYHPDKVAASEKEASEAQFREVAEAYEVLSDDEKRGAYDRGEDLQQGMQGPGPGGPFGGPFGFHQQQGGAQFHFQWG